MQFAGERPSQRYARLMSSFTPEWKTEIYSDDLRDLLADVDSYRLLEEVSRRSRADSDLGRILDVDIATYLPGELLVKVDITAMANSLEARSPFLDHHLMEWAAGLPIGLKVRNGETKLLLKRAVRPWLPEEILNYPKQGFGVPLASWLRGELRELAFDVLTDATARGRGLFRPAVVRNLLHRHIAGADHGLRLWTLLQLELWYRAHAAPHDHAMSGCPTVST
jgi:asparagine synthase (glutamine-hydrolysing)